MNTRDQTSFHSFLLMGLIAAASGTASFVGTSIINGQSTDLAASANVARLDARLAGVSDQLAAIQVGIIRQGEEIAKVPVLDVRISNLERVLQQQEARVERLERK